MARPAKVLGRTRSAESLRTRLLAWLKSKGAEPCLPPGTGRRTMAELKAIEVRSWRIFTRAGWLEVHLPYDAPCIHAHRAPGERMKRIGLLSINSRFQDWPAGSLPRDANQYSGKWNFSCYESEDRLFIDFTTLTEALLISGGRGK